MVNSPKDGQSERGFTLIELLITIVIAAILLTLAVPSYQDFIKRNGVESLQSRFAAAVITARTEAASRNSMVTICGSSDGASCAAGAWSNGWLVFTDRDGDGTVDNNDDFVIQVHKKPASYTVRVSNDKATPEAINTLTFNNQGFTKDGGRAFVTLCEPGNVVKYARGLNIERSGRTMKSRDSNNDGIHERVFDTGTSTAGTPTALSCS